jgi:hypothetical protein
VVRTKYSALAAVAVAILLSLAVFAASASATFEATMALRKQSARATGPAFVVEAGGGRRTRILDFKVEAGKCGSIYAPLIDAGKTSPGFAVGKGSATFNLAANGVKLRVDLRLRPRGEGLRADGLFEATIGDCHERIPLDMVSTAIRGGGRHT